MIYPFMVIKNDIEVTHTEMKDDNTVKVYFEQPVYLGFHSIECILPTYEWTENNGFSESELKYLDDYIHSVAHIIIELSKEGGFDNASGF